MERSVEYMAPDDYAELMGLNPASVRRMCRDGTVRAVRVGGRWRIPVEGPQAPASPAVSVEDLGRLLDRMQEACRVMRDLASDVERMAAASAAEAAA